MHSFVALLILVTDFQVIIAKETRVNNYLFFIIQALSCTYDQHKGTKMTEYDREKVMERHNEWRRDLAKGDWHGYPPAKNMQFVTYSCDLEGEAYQIAKANCKLPQPPEPTFSSLGSNNHTLIRGRYISKIGRAIPNYGVVLQTWFYTVGSYNDTYSLKPIHYNNSSIPFLQVCYNDVFSDYCVRIPAQFAKCIVIGYD
ncbi:hypothetical protein KIN20_024909 [Parelaphostrongylus tenuis]|uniref:SCP domain-containing protein n=1 Tax=Parelaphostrongylus tenuis TaxID=148309 RepID=A0AAD5ND20_PARTN|nr:hypothetical protein KIN20_024909 [Parelaphostrongylus tenuis]